MMGRGSEGVSCNFSDGCLFKLSWLCAIKVPGSAVCRAKEEHFGCLTCHCCQSTQEKFTKSTPGPFTHISQVLFYWL